MWTDDDVEDIEEPGIDDEDPDAKREREEYDRNLDDGWPSETDHWRKRGRA